MLKAEISSGAQTQKITQFERKKGLGIYFCRTKGQLLVSAQEHFNTQQSDGNSNPIGSPGPFALMDDQYNGQFNTSAVSDAEKTFTHGPKHTNLDGIHF